MKDLQDLIAMSERYDRGKHDHPGPAQRFQFNEVSAIVVPPTLETFNGMKAGMAPLHLTEHSLGQVCWKLGPAIFGKGSNASLPLAYFKAIRPDLRAVLLNDHLASPIMGNRTWLVRGFNPLDTTVLNPGNGAAGHPAYSIARAVLDGAYPCVANTDLMRAVDMAMADSEGELPCLRLARSFVDADQVRVRILYADVRKDDTAPNGNYYAIGAYIGNDEIGGGRVKVQPLIQRTTCENSIIIQADEGIALAHRGSLAAIMVQVKAAIGQMFHTAADAVEKMIMAEAERVPSFSEVLKGLAIQNGWTDAFALQVGIGSEGRETRAGLVNGISFAAHSTGQKPEEEARLEEYAGQILLTMRFPQMVRVALRTAEIGGEAGAIRLSEPSAEQGELM
jgi:hypothetical protein